MFSNFKKLFNSTKMIGTLHWSEHANSKMADYLRQVTFDLKSANPPIGLVIDSITNKGLCIIKNCFEPASLHRVRRDLVAWLEKSRFENSDSEHDRILKHGLTAANLPGLIENFTEYFHNPFYQKIAKTHLNCEDGEIAIPLDHMLLRARIKQYNSDTLWPTNRKVQFHAYGARHSFHQDYGLIPKQFWMNTWIPLSNIDKDTIGLAFVLPFTGEVYGLPFPDDIESFFAGTNSFIFTPDLNIGDIIIFSNKTVHGSFNNRNDFEPRYSLEFRSGLNRALDDKYKSNILTM